jgi:hypothetical protein
MNDSCCSELACLIAAITATKEENDLLMVIEAEVIEVVVIEADVEAEVDAI